MPLRSASVRRWFTAITKSAGLGGDWVPRELRHSFVSIENIAGLVGHSSTAVTEAVNQHNQAKSA